MPDIIVLIGPQGAGKGTQAHRLAQRLSLPIVATGDILREVGRSETELGRKVRDMQAAGQLVPDDILKSIVSERLRQDDCLDGCILDGFPRTAPQARLLEEIAKSQGHRIIAIYISVPRDILWKRLAGRLTCSECNTTYNRYFKPSKKEGICDLDGKQLFARADDNAEAIEKRLALYEEKTRPILDLYRNAGWLCEVDGTGSPDEVFARIVAAIGAPSAARQGWGSAGAPVVDKAR